MNHSPSQTNSRTLQLPSPKSDFEIIGRFEITGSCFAEGNLSGLAEEFCRRLAQGAVDIEVSHLAEEALIVEWLNNFIRYGHLAWEDFLVSADDHHFLRRVRALQPAVRIGLILKAGDLSTSSDSLMEIVRCLRADCVLSTIESLDAAIAVHDRPPAPKVYVQSANGEAETEANSALALGADGVVTDDPGRIRAAAHTGVHRPGTEGGKSLSHPGSR